jgi:conflict system STAND superfamily ATPase
VAFIQTIRTQREANRSVIEGIALGMIPVLVDGVLRICNSGNASDLLPSAVCLILFAVIAYFLWNPWKPPPPSGIVFPGIGPLTNKSAVPQAEDLARLLKRLGSKSSAILVIVGPSGAGKSTLVTTFLLPRLASSAEESWDHILVDHYDSVIQLKDDFGKRLDQVLSVTYSLLADPTCEATGIVLQKRGCPTGKLLIILDQAEQMSFMPPAALQWLVTILKKLKKVSGIRILLLLREDFYLKMRFLGAMLPLPDRLLEIPGLRASTDDGLLAKLEKVNVKSSAARLILDSLRTERMTLNTGRLARNILVKSHDVILPLELQVVGLMLETIAATHPIIDEELYLGRLNGKEGLIHVYFDTFMRASSDSNVSMGSLCVRKRAPQPVLTGRLG